VLVIRARVWHASYPETMWRREFRFATWVAALSALVMVLLAWVYDLPVRDPDNTEHYLVPTYVRLPLILLLALTVDIVPRAVWRARREPGTVVAAVRDVVAQRWSRREVRFVLVGLLTWYVSYVCYRNVKSYVPFVNPHLWDGKLEDSDRLLFLGRDPAVLVQELLGRDWAAHVLSYVYVSWMAVVPATLAMALVWSRNRRAGEWYVTAVALDWVLGALTYLAVPALGPVYADPDKFTDLPDTHVSLLQATLMSERQAVLVNPFTADTVQMIAAFISLHVAICTTLCVFAVLLEMRRGWRVAAWVYLALTSVSTIYFGWHYLVDLLGGAAIGVLAAWLAARGTGNQFRRLPAAAREVAPLEPAASPVEPVGNLNLR
jgi:membrane-associated phospholipid phosphatase